MSKIYITGISGTGKSTLAKELAQRGIPSFDIDAIPGLCHWRHKETRIAADYHTGVGKDWLEAHEWICDQKKIEGILARHQGHVAVLGVASNQDDFLYLFDKIFLLHCSEETFLRRLDTRDEGNHFAKDKSEQEHILSWYKKFEAKMLESGAIPINMEVPTTEIADQVLLILHRGGLPDGRDSLE